MDNIYTISVKQIEDFGKYLLAEERAPGTVEKYLSDVKKFRLWLGTGELCKESLTSWKGELCSSNRQPVTVNSTIAAVNSFLSYMGKSELKIKYLKLQKKIFRDSAREMTKEDYLKLISVAQSKNNNRLAMLIETICATGVRVSEVKYITVEAARKGRADISLKGKIRTILIPGKLARKLLKYSKRQKIYAGEIFITKEGKSLDRKQIWADMKKLCKKAGVSGTKVFPHNLRHLFARTFYKASRDIVSLSDVLGHSSIETTRIYLVTTGAEHAKKLEKLGLVS